MAVPAPVLDAVNAMLPDALAVAVVVLVAIISIAAFKFLRRGIDGGGSGGGTSESVVNFLSATNAHSASNQLDPFRKYRE